MSKIFVVLKKELRRFFTDRRMLTSIFLPGILIFIIYSLLGGVVTDMMSQQITDYSVHIENEPIEFSMIFDVSDWNVEKNKEVLTKEEAINKISEGSLDLYIIYEEDFYNKILAYDTTLGKAPDVEIYYNSTIDSSYALYNYVITYLSQIEAQLANKFDVNTDLNINYDMATEEDISTKII